jgi:hypothetical protein
MIQSVLLSEAFFVVVRHRAPSNLRLGGTCKQEDFRQSIAAATSNKELLTNFFVSCATGAAHKKSFVFLTLSGKQKDDEKSTF